MNSRPHGHSAESWKWAMQDNAGAMPRRSPIDLIGGRATINDGRVLRPLFPLSRTSPISQLR